VRVVELPPGFLGGAFNTLETGFSKSGVAGLLSIGFLRNRTALNETHIMKQNVTAPYMAVVGLVVASCTK
jgi:hypothetical protein